MNEIKEYYTKEHLHLIFDGVTIKLGLTEHAINMLREITYIEFLSDVGEIPKNNALLFIESIKIVHEITTPVSGILLSNNVAIANDLSVLNKTPESLGWLCEIKVQDFNPNEYMTKSDYITFVGKC